MTDRLKGLVVAFEADVRVDDADHIINAIRMLRGVSDVTELPIESSDWLARTRVRMELWEAIHSLFYPVLQV